MSALGFLAVSSMLAGGLPAFPRGRRRRLRMPDAMRETAADAKRARKAAKREEDARRTEEGRAYTWGTPSWLGASTPMGIWDAVEKWWRGYDDGWDYEPRWRARLNHRRSLPWVGRTWFDSEAQFFRTRTPRRMLREVKR